MKNVSKTTKQAASITLSRSQFEKISAIEGVHISTELTQLLEKFMDDGLNNDECRKQLLMHFKSKAA